MHRSSSKRKKMDRWGCASIIEHSIRSPLRTCIRSFWSRTCSTSLAKHGTLPNSTCAPNTMKCASPRETNQRQRAQQGTSLSNSFSCLLASRMHPPHFAHSWTRCFNYSSTVLWSCTWTISWRIAPRSRSIPNICNKSSKYSKTTSSSTKWRSAHSLNKNGVSWSQDCRRKTNDGKC